MKKFFKKFPEIYTTLSEKTDGSMKIVQNGSNDKNRARFFRKEKIFKENIASAGLENKTNVCVVNKKFPSVIEKTDALVTKEKNIFLSITVADCVPVFFYEPKAKIIAIAHAGWRGVVGEIVPKTTQVVAKLGGRTENLNVALGPGINRCHFEIKEDILDKFIGHEKFIQKKNGKIFVDLKGIIKKQLISSGVKSKNIENDETCTFESKKYFSYRRDKPQEIEAMVAVIGFK